MRKTVTTRLELNAVEAKWLKCLITETLDYSESDEKTNVRQKIITACTHIAPYSIRRPPPLNEVTLNEKEVEWLKELVQNPRCHPDQEDKTDKTLRYKFWTTLSNDIVRIAYAATLAEGDDIPF